VRILLTNDDGIHAPGLEILERIARELSDDIWIIAPEVERSGASRGVTLTDPIRVRAIGEKRFATTGTPTDCVILGLQELITGKMPDLVLSGVNRGQNIAEDVTLSGTVAGALQGMQLGVPSIALSQATNFRSAGSLPWETAQAHGARVIRSVLKSGWPADVVININFPDCEPDDVGPVEVTRQGARDEMILRAQRRDDPRGNAYYWLGYQGKLSLPPAGTDLLAIYEGRISVSPLHIDLTHQKALAALQASFATETAGP
jgi:5'-nucleotidase